MIARMWHGAVPNEKASAYLNRMRGVALPQYKATQGNLGAFCLQRVDGDLTHFEMLTFWEDVDAIKRFAGENYEAAYYYDFDDDFLVEKEPGVRHFSVFQN